MHTPRSVLLASALCVSLTGPLHAQSADDLTIAATALSGVDGVTVISCDAADVLAACGEAQFCSVRRDMLDFLFRAMETNIPNRILGAARQVTADSIRSEAHAACLTALVGDDPEILPSARTVASASDQQLADALGLADAFVEDGPGCPSTTQDGLSVARYTAADLALQEAFPLEARGTNDVAACVDGPVGFVTQRPQMTVYLTDIGDSAVEFRLVHAPCPAMLLLATADGMWRFGAVDEQRPAIRVSGSEADGRLSVWIGSLEAGATCRARFTLRAYDE